MDITASYSKNHEHREATNYVEKAACLLKWTYGLVPIVAGADKFMHLLTDWDKYLAPQIADILPFSPQVFMNIVGIVEISAGLAVLIRPRIGSLVVALWLIGIALNLLFTGQYFDVAVRDTVMAIGAFSLYILSSKQKNRKKI